MFPAGEQGVSVDVDIDMGSPLTIVWDYENDAELVKIALLKDALVRVGATDIQLKVPYFPYARQDRVCNPGESHSLKVVGELINSLKFDRVIVHDPHSSVMEAVIDRLCVVHQADAQYDNLIYLRRNGFNKDNTVLVAPDAGAAKKVYDVAKACGFDKVLVCHKRRDLTHGNIIDTMIPLEGSVDYNFVVIDDILDGGRTFIELGPLLKSYTSGKLVLSVTHGIFSKGIDVFENACYDKILVANMMNKELKNSEHKLLKG